jgi:hypothetical protein
MYAMLASHPRHSLQCGAGCLESNENQGRQDPATIQAPPKTEESQTHLSVAIRIVESRYWYQIPVYMVQTSILEPISRCTGHTAERKGLSSRAIRTTLSNQVELG